MRVVGCMFLMFFGLSLFASDKDKVVHKRLRALGFSERISQNIVQHRRDLHEGILQEAGDGIDPKVSRYRPVTVYRGVLVPIESYDSRFNQGPVLHSTGDVWVSIQREVGGLFANANNNLLLGEHHRLNYGVVTEMQVPHHFLDLHRGSLFAVPISLSQIPDMSIFTTQIGLGNLTAPLDQLSTIPHTRLSEYRGIHPPPITWLNTEEALGGTRIQLPRYQGSRCNEMLQAVSSHLPPIHDTPGF